MHTSLSWRSATGSVVMGPQLPISSSKCSRVCAIQVPASELRGPKTEAHQQRLSAAAAVSSCCTSSTLYSSTTNTSKRRAVIVQVASADTEIEDYTSPDNFYGILGVPENASSRDIKRAYKAMMKDFHPDLSGDEESTEFCILLNDIYEVGVAL